MLIITFLSNNSMVAAKGVACETTPGSPPEFLYFFCFWYRQQRCFPFGKHLSLFKFCVKWASMNNKISCSHLLSSLTVHNFVAIGWSSLFSLGITCGMATLFHNCSLLGFVPLEALEGLSTQRVWHGASQRGDRDRVKCARRSRAIHYKINDDVAAFTYFTRPLRKAGRGLGLEEHTPQPAPFYFRWEDRFQFNRPWRIFLFFLDALST